LLWALVLAVCINSPLLILTSFPAQVAAEPKLEWCEYMEKVGIDVPECRTSSEEEEEVEEGSRLRGRPRDKALLGGPDVEGEGSHDDAHDDDEPDSYESLSMFETCRGQYGRCHASIECESGTVCARRVSSLDGVEVGLDLEVLKFGQIFSNPLPNLHLPSSARWQQVLHLREGRDPMPIRGPARLLLQQAGPHQLV